MNAPSAVSNLSDSVTLNNAGDVSAQSTESQSAAQNLFGFWNQPSDASLWMPSYMTDTQNQAGDILMPSFTDASENLALNNAKEQSESVTAPYEVTLPEIVITPGSNNATLAEDIVSAPLMGDTLTENTALSETLNAAGEMPDLSSTQEKVEPKKKGFRGWLANKFQPLLASIGGASVEAKPYHRNQIGGDTTDSVTSVSDTLNQTIGNYADNSIPMPSMSESLSDATDISSTDSNQGDTLSNSVLQSSNSSSRNVTVDRVCDQIVINVQNTDGQGTEEIRSRILEVLNEIVEG